MKTPAARRSALEAETARAGALVKDLATGAAALSEALASLRARVERVLTDDAEAVQRDPSLRDRVIEARARVRELEQRLAPPPPVTTEPTRARGSTWEPLGLRRCGHCDGNVLHAVRGASLRTRAAREIPVTAVVCGYCGSVRLFVEDLDAIRRAPADEVERVTLPPGEGPFRGG